MYIVILHILSDEPKDYKRLIIFVLQQLSDVVHVVQPHKDLLTTVKRCKLQWYGDVSCSLGLAKTILQDTVKGGRRQGIQSKRWEDNIREWTGLAFAESKSAVKNK